jgi:NDP-sugar pyrophosphorylase family protein
MILGSAQAPTRLKSRLTITLSPDVLAQLDRLIDGKTLRNRSQAIETLLRGSLRPSVSTAVILAGGHQEGEKAPALLPVGGQPLISRTIQHLMGYGVHSFLVLAGDDEREIRALMGEGESVGATIRYLREQRPRGTGGALKLAEPYLGTDPFLVIHGDVLTDIDITGFIDFHFSENALATIAVKPRQAERHFGQVILQGNRITNFIESSREGGISIVNTGVYLFDPAILGLIEGTSRSQLETEVFPQLARMGELSAFFFQGIWFDISRAESYRSARARWKEKGG